MELETYRRYISIFGKKLTIGCFTFVIICTGSVLISFFASGIMSRDMTLGRFFMCLSFLWVTFFITSMAFSTDNTTGRASDIKLTKKQVVIFFLVLAITMLLSMTFGALDM
ncbi:MAG: hypothetical protein CSA50_06095 [Gammaproteobacteria bacterium]|nr:MAG: hypothetical protein CSA50_06095 [Gammaproteobacteria bacterium]